LTKPLQEAPQDFAKISELLERMNRDLQIADASVREEKLGGRLRRAMWPLSGYKTQESCHLAMGVNGAIAAMVTYCAHAFDENVATSLTWDDVTGFSGKAAEVLSRIRGDCDVTEARETVVELQWFLLRHGVITAEQFSSWCVSVTADDAQTPAIDTKDNVTFGVGPTEKQLWPLRETFRLISQLRHCATAVSNPGCRIALAPIYSTDLCGHVEALACCEHPFRLKAYLLKVFDQMTLPSEAESTSDCDVRNAHSGEKSAVLLDRHKQFTGGRSTNPVLSVSVASLIGAHRCVMKKHEKSFKLDNLHSELLSFFDVNLKNATAKSEQLLNLQRLLWVDAVSLSHVVTPACPLTPQLSFAVTYIMEVLTSLINDVISSDKAGVLYGNIDFRTTCQRITEGIAFFKSSTTDTQLDSKICIALGNLSCAAVAALQKTPPEASSTSSWAGNVIECLKHCTDDFLHVMHLLLGDNQESCPRCCAEVSCCGAHFIAAILKTTSSPPHQKRSCCYFLKCF